MSCFTKEKKETSLTPPPGQSYLSPGFQGHISRALFARAAPVLTSHTNLLLPWLGLRRCVGPAASQLLPAEPAAGPRLTAVSGTPRASFPGLSAGLSGPGKPPDVGS